MSDEINPHLEAMLRFSEFLVDPGTRKIPANEWLDCYNSAKDGHLKYILMKCIPYIDSIDLSIITNNVQTDCLYEKIDLINQLLNHHNSSKDQIVEWLCSLEDLSSTTTNNQCKDHCVCSLIKLGIGLIEKGAQWPTKLNTKLLKSIIRTNQRCSLNSYLDLILAAIEGNIHNDDYLEELYDTFVSAINPKDYITLNVTIDDQPEVIFNGISDCLLLRKMLLPRLIILSQLARTRIPIESINRELQSMEDLVSRSIHWSYHPFIDLYLEDDSMMLKCLNALVQLQSYTNEASIHSTIRLFLDSINHDVGVLIEWLSSDVEIADLTLQMLLTYLKLPTINYQCSAPVKIFFNQLLKRIDGLWKKQLFPYNPSALLKYQSKVAA